MARDLKATFVLLCFLCVGAGAEPSRSKGLGEKQVPVTLPATTSSQQSLSGWGCEWQSHEKDKGLYDEAWRQTCVDFVNSDKSPLSSRSPYNIHKTKEFETSEPSLVPWQAQQVWGTSVVNGEFLSPEDHALNGFPAVNESLKYLWVGHNMCTWERIKLFTGFVADSIRMVPNAKSYEFVNNGCSTFCLSIGWQPIVDHLKKTLAPLLKQNQKVVVCGNQGVTACTDESCDFGTQCPANIATNTSKSRLCFTVESDKIISTVTTPCNPGGACSPRADSRFSYCSDKQAANGWGCQYCSDQFQYETRPLSDCNRAHLSEVK